jgi:hypothetical protein
MNNPDGSCWTVSETLDGTCIDGRVEVTSCGESCLGYNWYSMSSAVLQRVESQADVIQVPDESLLAKQCTLTPYGEETMDFKATDNYCWGNCFSCDGTSSALMRPICIEQAASPAICACGCSGGSYEKCSSACPAGPADLAADCISGCRASCGGML